MNFVYVCDHAGHAFKTHFLLPTHSWWCPSCDSTRAKRVGFSLSRETAEELGVAHIGSIHLAGACVPYGAFVLKFRARVPRKRRKGYWFRAKEGQPYQGSRYRGYYACLACGKLSRIPLGIRPDGHSHSCTTCPFCSTAQYLVFDGWAERRMPVYD